ncbi:MFS transporter [Actinomadura latina]|uniref:MFS transporter n=1 Tax=Actinomadura latina TaxID=163603 RepID=UPI00083149AE|nr:MFS transporter [Actinomadura latina]
MSPSPSRWLALLAVLLATFMDLMDVTIVGVALREIQSDLRASYAVGQWISAGYALAFALLLVTGGRLGDIHGRRRVFLAGVAGFTAASALAAVAVSPGMLIAARVAQGAFGGVMVPQVMSIIATEFRTPRERTAAISLYGVVLGVGQVSGPLLGGLLLTSGLPPGWRTIFLVNLPVGLATLAGAWLWMSESRSVHRPRLDVPGVLLISVASLLLAYPLVQGRELGWPAWSVAAMAAAGPVLALFVLHQRRRERAGRGVLVPIGLFARRSYAGGLTLMFVLFTGVSGFFIVLTWTLQFGLGWSPLRVALVGLAWPAGIACTAQLTNRFGQPRARTLVALGTPVMAAATAGLAWAALHHGPGLDAWRAIPWMFAAGIGMGLTIPILSNLVLGDLPASDAGAASGVLNSVIQLGNAMGVALAGVVFFGARDSPGPRPADFTAAGGRTLLFSAAAFALAALLSPLLPRRVPRTAPDPMAHASHPMAPASP